MIVSLLTWLRYHARALAGSIKTTTTITTYTYNKRIWLANQELAELQMASRAIHGAMRAGKAISQNSNKTNQKLKDQATQAPRPSRLGQD